MKWHTHIYKYIQKGALIGLDWMAHRQDGEQKRKEGIKNDTQIFSMNNWIDFYVLKGAPVKEE